MIFEIKMAAVLQECMYTHVQSVCSSQ